jgi:hypothetical protein
MITLLLFLTSASFFALTLVDKSPQEMLVGVWKHHRDEVFFSFRPDGSMTCTIPCAQGVYEIPGTYELMDPNRLKIVLNSQYGSHTGEPIIGIPQVLHVTIQANGITFHDLKMAQSEEQEFVRIT